jgi:hypothetical protein
MKKIRPITLAPEELEAAPKRQKKWAEKLDRLWEMRKQQTITEDDFWSQVWDVVLDRPGCSHPLVPTPDALTGAQRSRCLRLAAPSATAKYASETTSSW